MLPPEGKADVRVKTVGKGIERLMKWRKDAAVEEGLENYFLMG